MAPCPIHALEISEQTYLILFITIQSIWTFIFVPSSIYYTIQLWKLSKSNILFISKRRPSMVILTVICINIYMIIFPLASSLPHHYHALDQFHNHEIEIIIGDTIYVIAYLVLFRVWLLYYDYQYEAHLLSVKWKRHILKQRDYKPWTLRHRWMGNTKIIISMLITCWVVACALVQFSIISIKQTNLWIYKYSVTKIYAIHICTSCGFYIQHRKRIYLDNERWHKLACIAYFCHISSGCHIHKLQN